LVEVSKNLTQGKLKHDDLQKIVTF